MKKIFGESIYRDDLVAIAAIILLSVKPDFSLRFAIAYVAGVLLGIIPRVISIYFGADGRSNAERIRAGVLFCIYLFLLLWSTDFTGADFQPLVVSFLAGATFYQLMLWMIITNAIRNTTVNDKKIDKPINQNKAYAAIALICLVLFGARLIAGASMKEALTSFSLVITVLAVSLLRRQSKSDTLINRDD